MYLDNRLTPNAHLSFYDWHFMLKLHILVKFIDYRIYIKVHRATNLSI